MAPRVGFEPTTLRLRLSQSFERGRTISSTRERVVGRWWGLIGLVPQPLVSARSRLHWLLLHPDHSAGFAQDYRFPKELGFPEFTRLFDHSRLWKLQHSCMQFTVTIRTQQDTRLAPILICTFVSQSKNYRQWLTAACSAIELPRSSRSEKYPEQLKVPTVHGSFQFD